MSHTPTLTIDRTSTNSATRKHLKKKKNIVRRQLLEDDELPRKIRQIIVRQHIIIDIIIDII